MKAIPIIGEEMADRSAKELSCKTLRSSPQTFAKSDSKDGILRRAMDRILPRMPPRSGTATLALLGYDALKVYSGGKAFRARASAMNSKRSCALKISAKKTN